MDKFVSQSRTRSSSVPQAMQQQGQDRINSMALTSGAQEMSGPSEERSDKIYIPNTGEGVQGDHERIAQAVAMLLKPTIIEAVDAALSKSFQSISVGIDTQEKRMQEAEERIVIAEEDISALYSSSNTADTCG